MDLSQKQILLQQMGVDVYKLRSTSNPPLESVGQNEVGQNSYSASETGLPQLAETVFSCQRCQLHQSRTQTVFGVGSSQAKVMFVGEAPGRDEDIQGEPFVGRAGQLLNLMLAALGWKREDIYIANILKCRPPNNRNPEIAEISECEQYLIQQIEMIKPQLLVALGRIAAQSLLATNTSISGLRGQKHLYEKGNIPIIVTYHPAYLLRNPIDKSKAWQDLLFIRSNLV